MRRFNKSILVFLLALIVSSTIYIACKKSELPGTGLSNGVLPFYPALKAGDTPGNVSFSSVWVGPGHANFTMHFTNGTPGLAVQCTYYVVSLANVNLTIPSYAGYGNLDNNGALTLTFDDIICSYSDLSNTMSNVRLICQTSQEPAIAANYLNGSQITINCP